MSSSLHHLNLSFLSTFFLVLSISFTNADLISDVCAKTQHPSICSQALRSDPRTKNADLEALGFISIDLSTNQAKSGQTLIHSLLKKPIDPKFKNRYLSCLDNYEGSVGMLGSCPGFLRKKDYESLNFYASATQNEAATCDESFVDPSVEPSQLRDASVKLQALCSAILVVCNKLRGA